MTSVATVEEPLQGELYLSPGRAWEAVPSPKVKRPRVGDPFAWSYTYTGFSLAFARTALQRLGVRPGSTVLDPFVGSGTTLVAAALAGSSALGVDVSPFSALLSRARLAISINMSQVLDYLDALPGADIQHLDVDLLTSPDNEYAAAAVAKILGSTQSARAISWLEMLSDDVGRHDNEALALLSLTLGARDCARVLRGSNPIWYRKAPNVHKGKIPDLRTASLACAARIGRDLSAATGFNRTGARVLNADFSAATIDESFDFCLTSPPYLNRLDYVVAHLPELSILQHVAPIDIEQLRATMIGTTKIVAKDESHIPESWGPTCKKTLNLIFNHKAYASRRYYYHTYRQYFASLFSSFERIIKLIRPGGHGVMVIQNSYYKNIDVPTPQISSEMMRSLSCKSYVARTAPVRMHMGRMSPKQVAYVPDKVLGESVIYFNKQS